MKRDCGTGDMIPWKWKVMWCDGPGDREHDTSFTEKHNALADFEARVELYQDKPATNVRLYCIDKQGYGNCLKYWNHRNGLVTDRMSEL